MDPVEAGNLLRAIVAGVANAILMFWLRIGWIVWRRHLDVSTSPRTILWLTALFGVIGLSAILTIWTRAGEPISSSIFGITVIAVLVMIGLTATFTRDVYRKPPEEPPEEEDQ